MAVVESLSNTTQGNAPEKFSSVCRHKLSWSFSWDSRNFPRGVTPKLYSFSASHSVGKPNKNPPVDRIKGLISKETIQKASFPKDI